MHAPVGAVGEWLKRVVEGYYRYHAVPGNSGVLERFRERLCRLWRHVSAPPQPTAAARMGSLAPYLRPLDSSPPCPASLSQRAL